MKPLIDGKTDAPGLNARGYDDPAALFAVFFRKTSRGQVSFPQFFRSAIAAMTFFR
jgi:hypothetical protein